MKLKQEVRNNETESPVEPIPAVTRTWAARAVGALVFLVGGGILGLALWLKPDARGYGTHEQLSGAACGWLLVTHYPCPTCGMTTAFAHVVRGQWWRAFLAQPAGFVLALMTIAGTLLGGRMVLTNRWPVRLAAVVTPYRLCLGVLVLLIGGWAFKLVYGLATGELPLR